MSMQPNGVCVPRQEFSLQEKKKILTVTCVTSYSEVAGSRVGESLVSLVSIPKRPVYPCAENETGIVGDE